MNAAGKWLRKIAAFALVCYMGLAFAEDIYLDLGAPGNPWNTNINDRQTQVALKLTEMGRAFKDGDRVFVNYNDNYTGVMKVVGSGNLLRMVEVQTPTTSAQHADGSGGEGWGCGGTPVIVGYWQPASVSVDGYSSGTSWQFVATGFEWVTQNCN